MDPNLKTKNGGFNFKQISLNQDQSPLNASIDTSC